MDLLLQAAERLSLTFFADGANVARTNAALAAARGVYGQPAAPATGSSERCSIDAPVAAMLENRDVAPPCEVLSA